MQGLSGQGGGGPSAPLLTALGCLASLPPLHAAEDDAMPCLCPTTSPYHQHSLSSCFSTRPHPPASRPWQHHGIVPCPASPSSPPRLRCTMVLLIFIASAIATQPPSLISLPASPQHTHKARLIALPSHDTPPIASPQPHPMQLRSTMAPTRPFTMQPPPAPPTATMPTQHTGQQPP